uniref:Indoleamine 2,3-dioxygenase 2-like n=1 Tax=Paramormyrops kingsleyae TaxID=1676925 RepID=A0A3B3QJ90_9TELE
MAATHKSADDGSLHVCPFQTDLPEYYQPWMSIAMDLPHLIQTHQVWDRVHKMPLLSITHLEGHREQRMAHLALGFITMGYVWQEGEHQPVKTLPRQLAEPYCRVSEALDMPPILLYADCVLANWKLRDPAGSVHALLLFSYNHAGASSWSPCWWNRLHAQGWR